MTNPATIKSIRQNGGWCQLHHSNDVPLINVLCGRILFYTEELSFVEKFDLSTDSLKGYFVVLNKTKQRLKKANWIKQILTINGKVINDTNLPKALFTETLHDFFAKLKFSKELNILRLKNGNHTCYISDFSDSELTVEILFAADGLKKMKIDFSNIVCIELKTTNIHQQAQG